MAQIGGVQHGPSSVDAAQVGGDQAGLVESSTREARVAKVGVILISESYLESKHCGKEMREMLDSQESGKMTLIGVKLHPEKLQLPERLSTVHYLRWYEHSADGEALSLISEIESHAADDKVARPLQEIGELIDDFEFEQALDRLHSLREAVTS